MVRFASSTTLRLSLRLIISLVTRVSAFTSQTPEAGGETPTIVALVGLIEMKDSRKIDEIRKRIDNRLVFFMF